MARMHGARWITLRHDFIDWFGSGIEPGTIVTNRSQVSIALGRHLRTKLLQPTTHAQRYAAIRQTNGLSIVKPTAMVETKGPWVSMVLLRRFAVQFLQARVREG